MNSNKIIIFTSLLKLKFDQHVCQAGVDTPNMDRPPHVMFQNDR